MIDNILFMLFRSRRSILSVYCRVFLVLFVAAVLGAGLVGCGEEKEDAKADQSQPVDKYADWTWYSYGRVKIFHPPDHLQLSHFKEYCEKYESSINQISKLPAPNDDVLPTITYP